MNPNRPSAVEIVGPEVVVNHVGDYYNYTQVEHAKPAHGLRTRQSSWHRHHYISSNEVIFLNPQIWQIRI
jgi:hypothetical protein